MLWPYFQAIFRLYTLALRVMRVHYSQGQRIQPDDCLKRAEICSCVTYCTTQYNKMLLCFDCQLHIFYFVYKKKYNSIKQYNALFSRPNLLLSTVCGNHMYRYSSIKTYCLAVHVKWQKRVHSSSGISASFNRESIEVDREGVNKRKCQTVKSLRKGFSTPIKCL